MTRDNGRATPEKCRAPRNLTLVIDEAVGWHAQSLRWAWPGTTRCSPRPSQSLRACHPPELVSVADSRNEEGGTTMSRLGGDAHANGELHVLLYSAKVGSIILAMGIVSLSGCDPGRTIAHHVTVAVVDEQGSPVSDVNVSMKESWESWGSGVEEADKAYCRQLWVGDFVPWLKGVTNAQGTAVISIRINAMGESQQGRGVATGESQQGRS